MVWLKLIEIFWAWPTVAIAVLFLFHRELRSLLVRIATSSRAKFGSLEIEMGPPPGALQQEPLAAIESKSFNSGVVELDGKQFTSCTFDTVTLRYRARRPVGLVDCQFGNVRWEFADSASLTMSFLAGLYKGASEGGRQLVENTFNNIRAGEKA